MARPLALLLPALLLAACEDRGAARAPAAAARDPVPAAPDSGAPAVPPAAGDTAAVAVRGLFYVPVYSHIYFRDQRRSIDLAVTLSVRNTDPERAITVSAVRYYDTAGRLLHAYLRAPVRLGPMASAEYVVAERDAPGGTGANFLVEWRADQRVTDPIVEAVMISTESSLGISFTSVGRPLVRH